jgi:hypothetical protein
MKWKRVFETVGVLLIFAMMCGAALLISYLAGGRFE